MKIKVPIWLLVIPLTVYAPAELTRRIILLGLAPELVFELLFFWVFYIGGMYIVWKLAGYVV